MSVCVIGSLNLDIICRVDDLPAPGETVATGSVARLAGGKGLNQAVAAARHGAPSRMIGAVGDDDAGRDLLARLRAEGVDIAGVAVIASAATGQAFIAVSAAAENMIVVAGGANTALTGAQVLAAAASTGTVFLAQLETPVEAIRALFETPAARRGLTILNAAPAVAEGRSLFDLCDIIIVNETELARYGGLDQPPASTPAMERAARGLISRADQTIVVTLGRAGAVAVGLDRLDQVTGRAVSAIDTTGAGDCFCGVLAAALHEGAGMAQALATANAAAALSTQTPGAAAAMPRRGQTEAFKGSIEVKIDPFGSLGRDGGLDKVYDQPSSRNKGR